MGELEKLFKNKTLSFIFKVLFDPHSLSEGQKIEIFLKDKIENIYKKPPVKPAPKMSKQTQTTTTRSATKSGCAYCRSLGKPESVWTSHFVHKTPSDNSRLTCPELLKRVCTSCSSQNHTYDKCKKRLLTAGVCLISDMGARVPDVQQPKSQLGRYADLIDDSDEEEEAEPVCRLTHEEIMEITSDW